MYVFAYTAMDVLMALFTYYLTYYMRRPGLYSLAMGSLMVAQLATMPIYMMVAIKKSKALAYTIGLSIWALGMVLTALLRPEAPALQVALVCAFIGTGTAAGVLIPYMILPFVIDVDELITGRQRSGEYAGAMTLMRKLVQGAIALPTIGFMLQGIGFIPNTAQSPVTLAKFFTFFIGVPAALIVLGILSAGRFKIVYRDHRTPRRRAPRGAGCDPGRRHRTRDYTDEEPPELHQQDRARRSEEFQGRIKYIFHDEELTSTKQGSSFLHWLTCSVGLDSVKR
jgi:oligogalacturonide transporter